MSDSENNIVIKKDDTLATSQMIEDGSYFTEALKWYNDIFVGIAISKFIYIIFFFTYSIAIYMIFVFINNLMPLKVKTYLMIFTKREADTYLNVKPIKDFQGVAKNIAAMTLKNYITEREEYRLDKYRKPFEIIKTKMDSIKNNSSTTVYEEFRRSINIPTSAPYALINNNMQTLIEIKSFTFTYPEQTIWEKFSAQFIPLPPPTNAKVIFTTTSQDKIQYWEAQITYNIDIPPSNAKGANNTIKLKVESYYTRKINTPTAKEKGKTKT